MYFDDILSKTFNQDKIAEDIEWGTTATYVYALMQLMATLTKKDNYVYTVYA